MTRPAWLQRYRERKEREQEERRKAQEEARAAQLELRRATRAQARHARDMYAFYTHQWKLLAFERRGCEDPARIEELDPMIYDAREHTNRALLQFEALQERLDKL